MHWAAVGQRFDDDSEYTMPSGHRNGRDTDSSRGRCAETILQEVQDRFEESVTECLYRR